MIKRMFIPGPVNLCENTRNSLSKQMIGHRSEDFSKLYREVTGNLRKIMFTDNRIFLSTSSGSGLMEAATRNLVQNKSLHLVNGAFSEKWFKIAKANGKKAEKLEYDWGLGIKAGDVEEQLSKEKFDAVFLTHNETSTGAMNKLEKIAKIVQDFPETMFCVDAVSSLGGVKIETDKLGIDVLLASSQKCLAIPPGLAMASVSDRAIKRASETKNRGHYFDFTEFAKYDKKAQTPSTPAIPQIYALNHKLNEILDEGLEQRFERHWEMAKLVQGWAEEEWALFAEPGYESLTVTAVENNKGLDVSELISKLEKEGFLIGNGYGKLAGRTFRIAHMGDTSLNDVNELLETINEIVEAMN